MQADPTQALTRSHLRTFLSAMPLPQAGCRVLALTSGVYADFEPLFIPSHRVILEAGASAGSSPALPGIPHAIAPIICQREYLPLASDRFDLIICLWPSRHAAGAEPLLDEAARVLKPGGQLVVEDAVVPDDPRAARYVNAFHRLRSRGFERAYAVYEWEGKFMNAGLAITHTQVIASRERLVEVAPPAPEVLLRLQVLLAQAPRLVSDFWQPACVGTLDATFGQADLIIAGRKQRVS